jgi:hypothetical protein
MPPHRNAYRPVVMGTRGLWSEGASTAPSEASPKSRVAPAKPALERGGT